MYANPRHDSKRTSDYIEKGTDSTPQSVCGFGYGPKAQEPGLHSLGEGNRKTQLSTGAFVYMNVRVTGLVQSVIRSEEKS